MGTKLHCKNYFPGFYSMRDLNENSSNSSWPVFYGDKMVSNGPYYYGFVPRTSVEGYPGHDKDTLKQKMLEHEAVFKNQVCELHRLYGIQRGMMEEVKRKEVIEPASSSHHGSQAPLEDARKCHMAGFPFLNPSYGGTSYRNVENSNSPISCTNGVVTLLGHSTLHNDSTSKDYEALHLRPLKVRKKLFDLQLPADQYVDPDDMENSSGYNECDISSYTKTDGPINGSASTSHLMGSTGLADLNEPIQIEEEIGPSSIDLLGHTCENASRVNKNGWFSHLNIAGSSRGNLSSVTQGCQAEKTHLPSHPGKDTYYGREDLWREGFRHGLESSRRYHLEPMAPQNPGSYPFYSSSSFTSSWAQPISYWARPKLNGFYHASASGSKEPQVSSDRTTNHGFGSFPKGPYHADLKPVIDINLNEVLPESPLNETAIPASSTDGKSKPEDDLQTLPWPKTKPVHVNEVSRSELSRESGLLHASCKNVTDGVTFPTKKILGVPIFERDVPENGPSSHVSKAVISERRSVLIDINVACEPDEEVCDEELTVRKESPKKGPSVKGHIDLNTCVSDYEDPPLQQKSASAKKIRIEIDLEAPVFLESEDDSTQSLENKHEEIQDDVLANAAETLVSLSSCPKVGVEDSACLPTESSLEEAFLLFVDAVNASGKESRIPEASDDFEAMTLQLAETREQDYMPKPFVPEFSETGPTALTARTRRGHSRRGRQRRDFQRDILPGLASLSRPEVTEDLQTFGGLMKATGHSWSSGLARRNGGSRGRRRAVVEVGPPAGPDAVCAPLIKQVNTVESGLEDRSLTGWGKTTRRPRRQRCPAGNPPTVVLA